MPIQPEGAGDDLPGAITTRRLELAPLKAADMPAADVLAGGPVNPGQPLRHDLADARAWMSRARLTPNALLLSVSESAGGRLVGGAGAAAASDVAGRIEIGLWIGDPFWGHGYGTEAAQALIDTVFEREGTDALWAVCRFTNSAARRVLEKCGFQFRERGMARSVSLRGAVPVERFALERRVWSSLKSWAGRGEAGGEAHAPAA